MRFDTCLVLHIIRATQRLCSQLLMSNMYQVSTLYMAITFCGEKSKNQKVNPIDTGFELATTGSEAACDTNSTKEVPRLFYR